MGNIEQTTNGRNLSDPASESSQYPTYNKRNFNQIMIVLNMLIGQLKFKLAKLSVQIDQIDQIDPEYEIFERLRVTKPIYE